VYNRCDLQKVIIHLSGCTDKYADDIIKKLLKIWNKKANQYYDNNVAVIDDV
jgi:hypothetical protein